MSNKQELTSAVNPAPPQGTMHAIRGYMASDAGRVRSENQDSVGITETDKLRIYLIADGMGGARGGQKASRLAVDSLSHTLISSSRIDPEFLTAALKQINQKINDEADRKPALKGMGTTLVGLVFTQAGVQVMNVGDSRAYLLREGQLIRMTDDHTIVAELVRGGALTEEQARTNPISNLLTRSLGANTAVEPDCRLFPNAPRADDIYLLCSDGLYRYLSDKEIAQVLGQYPAHKAAEKLVSLANERGGEDNISALVIRVDRQLFSPVTKHAQDFQGKEQPRFVDSVQVDSALAGRLQALRSKELTEPMSSVTTFTNNAQISGVRTKSILGQVLLISAAFLAGIGLTSYLHVRQLPENGQSKKSAELTSLTSERTNTVALKQEVPESAVRKIPSRDFASTEQLGIADSDSIRAHLSPGALPKNTEPAKVQLKSPHDIAIELNNVQAQIDTETRKLTTWFIRQRQIEAGMPSAIAQEIAVSSPSVRQLKQSFDAANWDYLREAETLLYNPADESLEKKVKELSRLREMRLKDLDEGVKVAVRSTLDTALSHLYELSIQRDQLQSALKGNKTVKRGR